MPTLSNPSGRVRIPVPLTGSSTRTPVAHANKILSEITPAASDGNSIEDHVSDIKAELGHRTDNDEFKGVYSPSTTYAIGDEVSWTDGSGKKRFYKRIVAGDDGGAGNPSTHTDSWIVLGANIHDITTGDYALTTNEGVLESLPNGTIRFNRRIATMLANIITEAQVQTDIEAGIREVIDNRLWRGAWAARQYATGDFVFHNGHYFQARTAIAASVNTPPASDTARWTQLTVDGYHYQIAERLEAITNLLAERLHLAPDSSNRGLWIGRRADNERYAYNNPPMQWQGAWSADATYYFGDAVNHSTRLWVLTASATIQSGKTGSSTEPGTDSSWTQIEVGHTSDVPGWRGAFVDLAGASLRQGDLVTHRGNYYIARNDLPTRPSTAPDVDEDNWDLLDIILGDYADDEWYPAGGIIKYDNMWWYSTDYVSSSDPDPGAAGDTKWLQIGGYATKDEFAQLQRDIADLSHGSRTSRGVLVENLPFPAVAEDSPEVWLPRKTVRTWTVDASLITGNTGRSANIGDEPGQYKLTSGPLNTAKGVIGKFVDENNRIWYGILTRAEDGAVWPKDAGTWEHNPVGSAIIGCGTQQIGGNSWRERLLIKKGILIAIGAGSNPSSFLLELTKHDGTKVTVGFSSGGTEHTFHGVTYEYWQNDGPTRGEFGNIYESGSNDAERTVEIAILLSGGGSPRWLGNTQYDWTRQPPITSSDDIPVYSEDVHTIQVMARSEYRALTTLPPRTFIAIYEDA